MRYDVSILVPIYNVSQFIERCLHSLFMQTHASIQFIFIDDCSPDNSLEILQCVLSRYPAREGDVKIIRHNWNRGLAAARNTGVANAEGEFILHMDSDDYADNNMVEEMYSLAKSQNADIVIADFYLQWKKSKKYVHQFYSPHKTEFLERLLESSAMPAVWNKMFRRDIYVSNNLAAIEGINVGEDFSVTPKLVYLSQNIAKIDKAFVHYVQYNVGSYTKRISDKNIQDILFVINNLEIYFSQIPESEGMLRALKIGKLKKKLELIKQIDNKRLGSILEMFPENMTKEISSKFNFFDRLLLALSTWSVTLLRIVICGYKKAFSTVQFLKRR